MWGIHEQRLGAHQIVEPVRMLCWAAKWHGQKSVQFRSEHHHTREQMIADLWELLDKADAVVHFNGKKFDVPHINREFILAGLGPPSPYAQVDLWLTVRSKFRFMSSKLDYVAGALGLGHKVPHEGFGLWVKCLAGDKAAWTRMKRYNIGDVRLTEELYDEILPWIQTHPSVALADGRPNACPKCGAEDSLMRRGIYRTAESAFHKYQCKGCGSYVRGTKKVAATNVRAVS